MKYELKDRVIDFVRNFCDKYNFTKQNLSDILIAVGLSALIAFGIASGVSPSVDAIWQDIDRLDERDQDILTALDELEGRDAALNSTLSGQVASIDESTVLLNDLQARVRNIICSSPDAHLEGTFGSYTLYVKSSKAGLFTADIHLLYSPPISAGNTTNYTGAVQYFYDSINWTEANQVYTPTVAYNGTAWRISKVSFNIGTFMLEAHTEAVIDIIFMGLEYEPAYNYIEVYPVLI